ncbi:hypothetical protein ACHQM5_021266 [Ranunculus cassubicifolius]
MMKDSRVEDPRIVVGSPSEKTREIRVRQQQPEWLPESKLDLVKDPIVQSSPSEKIREVVVRRQEWRPDPYVTQGDYIHEKRPMRSLRSLSPPAVERSGRIIDGYRRGVSIERDEYDMQFFDDRDGNDYTRSPPFRQVRPHIDHEEVSVRQVRPHIDEEVSFRGRRIPREALNERRDKYTYQEYRDPYVHLKPKVKHFGGSGSSGSQYSQEKHLQGPERSSLMPPQSVVSTLKSGRIGGSGPSSSSINLNIRPRNDEEFQFEENLRSDRIATKEFYKGEYDPQLYADDIYDHVSVSSHKDFRSLAPGVSRENFLEESSHSYGFSRRQGRYIGSGVQDEYNEDTFSEFARGPGIRQKDLTLYRDDPRSSARREPREYSYHEHGRREEDSARVRPEIYREDEPNERGTYTRRVLLRPIATGPVVDEVQYIESSRRIYRESNSRGHHSLQAERPSNYRNTKNSLLRADHDAEVFGSEINNSGMKLSREPERTRPVGDYGFGRDAGPLSQKERMKRLQMSEIDPDMRRQDVIPQRRLKAEDLSIYDPPERMLKRRYPIDEDMSRHGDRRIVASDRIISRQAQEPNSDDEQWITENTSESFSSKRLRYSHLQYEKSERPNEGRVTSRMSESDGWASHQDVSAHVHKRAVDHYTGDGNVNIKERLRPCPSTYHNSYNMGRKQDFYKSDRTGKRNHDNQYDALLTDDDNPLEEMDAPGKPDLPEDSDEFKQLVENYFLQYSKLLNQKPSTQRRYREQGNAGFLLCIVCGRLSKEFQDTRSLVTHTFMSRKIGKRAQHFALNKAICVLMGWKSTITLTGACVYDVLPETEAWALKEDQILWPPFVIIHDSTVFKDSSETREVFTIEQMETILRGMGISGGKVRYGKPVNQSIMLVKFLPTFSGLQEAERLHKYYTENTRGRGEFQKVKANSRNIRRDEQVQEEKSEKVLYGYMGIAEDLDKLDFDSKKKCVIKSKKEIYAIADAPLIKEG